ncbi:hypothetical protein SAMN05216241_103276 [Limimonas halophila]|uniref:LysM domain-containing protein n=1 Tax=Limimonas halophila TaxID=1082479 RepID=A0A1G7Q8C0_9PROT|nr:LysM peptidoglycan-binding domain-containing protein [Limimonas halophila]SDF83690.1 hypothetical protein SAMN05216241_102507 [Limimonas halophila]SDF94708.1 hypothetical protein SAMN05216241_103276 [Limimonas halophila]
MRHTIRPYVITGILGAIVLAVAAGVVHRLGFFESRDTATGSTPASTAEAGDRGSESTGADAAPQDDASQEKDTAAQDTADSDRQDAPAADTGATRETAQAVKPQAPAIALNAAGRDRDAPGAGERPDEPALGSETGAPAEERAATAPARDAQPGAISAEPAKPAKPTIALDARAPDRDGTISAGRTEKAVSANESTATADDKAAVAPTDAVAPDGTATTADPTAADAGGDAPRPVAGKPDRPTAGARGDGDTADAPRVVKPAIGRTQTGARETPAAAVAPPAIPARDARSRDRLAAGSSPAVNPPDWLPTPTGPASARAGADTAAVAPEKPEIRVEARPRSASRRDESKTAATANDGADKDSQAPSFDIVRVDPEGDAVVAGRAPPHSRVTLMDKDEPVARTRANSNGEFVAIPPAGLDGGKRRLTLRAEAERGDTRVSPNAVMVAVPEARDDGGAEQGGPAQKLTAIQVPRKGEGRVELLQQRAGGIGDQGGTLRLGTIRYTVSGHIDVRGRATPGDLVVLIVDERTMGRARVGADGRWRIIPADTLEPGMHRVRIEQRDSNGSVVASVTTPFSSQPLVGARADSDFVVIQPGNNLWSIAERTYGVGNRYHVIYQANAGQIEDPDLIYPGQVFMLPQRDG